jgi:lipoprotein-anchoring transpeptidase ErfK/SrfK
MRALLGRVAAVTLVGASVLATGATARADDHETTTTTPTTAPTTTTTTTTTTSTTTTTTTTAPPLVIELPSPPTGLTPQRGTQAQVTDTQPPPPTTTTLPPSWVLPANSGEGRRVVYSKSHMRVWTVEADGTVSKTHLVSGRRTWNQPLPGTYSVFSRSSYTCNIKNPDICWRYMVRFTKGPEGDNIGFHEIPKNIRTGAPLQSVSQLGQALSGGCVRQATPDAQYMWGWAPVGTKVVVLG